MEKVFSTQFEQAKFFKRGKVRDIYDLGDKYLIVATDRISCFDVILPTPIPAKGKVLTSLSLFWFNFTKELIEDHIISGDLKDLPEYLLEYEAVLNGRFVLVKKAEPLPLECVVRGYLAGSGFKEYKKNQSICGIKLPAGLLEADRLNEPIFTPSTKADSGHDENITEEKAKEIVGKDIFYRIKEKSIEIYRKASFYAESKGIIIADTKFEFGLLNDKIILIDEILTPDSSRFWPKEGYEPGKPQLSFDKQFVRDYLESIDWDKTPPAPALPGDIVEKTKEKYLKALYLLAGIRVD
ncbi:MAG: phosphoribosylaminoimidazolesuccinocarboxamide synthase [Candidatus Omnitrophica bacterium]|nr:phosphoribosylaminoimidazolesuccinocarboxamide synthase [Candidatus Omnitrophota bacterium]